MWLSSPVETNPLEAAKNKKKQNKENSPKVPACSCGFWMTMKREPPAERDPSRPHQQKPECLSPQPCAWQGCSYHSDSRGRWPGHAFWGEKKNSLCLFFFLNGESFLWLPPPFLLPSVTSKCQPAWETPGDLWSAGREPLKTYTIKFFLPFTLMSYWKARWHFAIMQRAQLWSLVRWNVIHKYVMPGIYWCFAAASASSRSSLGLFFSRFSFSFPLARRRAAPWQSNEALL